MPHPALCKFVVDGLKQDRIITSRDGPDGNVLKIKPPLTFTDANVDELVGSIDKYESASAKGGRRAFYARFACPALTHLSHAQVARAGRRRLPQVGPAHVGILGREEERKREEIEDEIEIEND